MSEVENTDKGLKAAEKVAKSAIRKGEITDFSIINLTVPNKELEQKNKDLINTDYVPFGSDNLFINKLADMARQSGFHRAILNRKYQFTVGDLLDGDVPFDTSFKNKTFFIPKGGIGVKKSIDNVTKDRYWFNNAYLVITESPRLGISIEHIDATLVRRTKNGDMVWVCPDWRQYQSYYQGKETKYPLFPNYDTLRGGIKRTCIQIKDYEPEFSWYGVPSYMGSLNTIAILYKTDKWQISSLDNSMKIGGVMEIIGSLDPKKSKELKEKIEAAYTGEGNNDKLIVMIKSPSQNTQGSQMIPFAQNKDGDWMNLNDAKYSELIACHDWYPSLMGRENNTGFDTKRVLNEYDIARTTTINPTRIKIIDEIRDVLQAFGRSDFDNARIHSAMPISFMADLDINSILTIDEGRKMIGWAPIDSTEKDKGKEIINEKKTAHLSNQEGIKPLKQK